MRSRVVPIAGLVLTLATGCSWIGMSDRELDQELAQERKAVAENPAASLDRLERVAWRRKDSIPIRELLVEACLKVDTIESRRIAEKALRELIVLVPDEPSYRFQLVELLDTRGFARDARIAIDRLLERSPNHPGAYLALGRYHEALYRRYRLHEDLVPMLTSYARAASLDPENPVAATKEIESLMVDGDWDAALGHLDVSRERWPDDPWLDALAGACLARPGTYPEAESAFRTAILHMTPSDRGAFESLKLVADPYTADHFDMMGPEEREDFLRIFWRSKDPLPVTPVNERLVEHWRRIVMTDLLYGLPRLKLRGWETDRGQMYIRYGAPVYEEYTQGDAGLVTQSSWFYVYDLNGEPLPVDFFDWTLNGNYIQPFMSTPTPADLAAYTGPQTYTHDYGGSWITPAVQVGRFRGPTAEVPRTEVYLAVAAESLATYHGSTLDFGAVAFDDEWQEVARSDEVVDLDTAPLAGESNRALVHQFELQLRPGKYTVASQVEGEAGAVIGTRSTEIEVGPFVAGKVALSEVEMCFSAGPDGPAGFEKGRLKVVPNPTGEVRGKEPLVVYFEIYNLTKAKAGGTRYSLHYQILPADKEGKSIFSRMAGAFRSRNFIESSFVEEGPEGVVVRSLSIDLGSLPEDRYQLTLDVTDLETGAVASREIIFRRAGTRP
jgi:GWxTD domain-containing protein